ncbi:MAG: hypothetical protein HPY55_13875 [Firmicutes bacterium]|nr:hypothetical protein [Bacillota bacterium]
MEDRENLILREVTGEGSATETDGHALTKSARRLLLVSLTAIVCLGIVLPAAILEDRLPYPVAVVVSEYPKKPIKGIEDAEVVYEWIEWDGSTSLLVVFTRRPRSDVGPLGPMWVGTAHLAYSCGNVVCGTTLPEADELSRSQEYPLSTISGVNGDYIAPGRLVARMKEQRYRVVPEEGHLVHRGMLKVEGNHAPAVVGRRNDGAEVFRWTWDGRCYQREVGDARVRVSSLVVLHTGGGHDECGSFPDGFFVMDGGRAVVFARGQRVEASWSRLSPTAPVRLEKDGLGQISLPQGRLWFHIVTSDSACEVVAGED